MRIIAGKYKGKVLKEFELAHIRPTLDRVKVTMFDKLQFKCRDASVLDLFGGTGSLGLEALSRGAKQVYIVDNNTLSVDVIKQNTMSFADKPNIMCMDYKQALQTFANNGTKFDIIFVDPPYQSNFGVESIDLIAKFKLLNPQGVIVYEHDDPFTYSGNDFMVETRHYGRVYVSYLSIK